MTRQPNILLLMADQMAAAYLPSYGHRVVKAPALQRLADRGVQFNSMYSNSPLCAPARFTMMSGQINSRIGAYDNASEFASSIPTFAHHLRNAGYQTALAGKMHFVGPDQLHGFEDRLTTDIYPADFGWTPNWDDADGRFDWWFHNMDSVVNAGVAEATNQLDYDDEVGFRTVRKLRDLARTSDDRPWMLTASFTHPHDPYAMRRQYWDLYDHDDIDLPRVGPLPADELDPHSRRLRNVSAMDRTAITEAQVRNARHAYYAAISYVDEWVGTIVDTLQTCGMYDDTVVMFTADHGDMLGERGLWYKMNFFEGSARVPMVVHAPKLFAPKRIAAPVSLVDVLPTVTDLVGAAAPEHLEPSAGRSLLDLCAGGPSADREVVGEYLGEGAIAPIVMIRRGDLKYVHSPVDPDQLYDLAADPQERVNLALDPDWSVPVKELRARVERDWDMDALHADVVADQARRRLVNAALRTGTVTPWEYTPPSDGGGQYMRKHLDLNVVERASRYPR